MAIMPFLSYSVFGIFLFYQKLHASQFQGASVFFHFTLSAFALISSLAGLALVIYYGYDQSWLYAAAVFGVAFLLKLIWFAIEARLGLRWMAPYISLAGFAVIPFSLWAFWSSFT
ncbi:MULTISPECIES: hypothetical protein [unclassified Marinobacter]|uniref:hypothetical protein n=1 Tax=unclassified Marinobacter TaxID=83889 RepID=UPI00192691D9|nr:MULTISPECIES: hypothetical protein [unclassified Marinobacter]MBL3825178.1 hypothetical protein [Marinobacter sp. MC3]MBL3893618.1 hypothetical protein [Marinobacter sp. MW3]